MHGDRTVENKMSSGDVMKERGPSVTYKKSEKNETLQLLRRKTNYSNLELPNGRNSLFEINPLASNIGSNMHSKGHSSSIEHLVVQASGQGAGGGGTTGTITPFQEVIDCDCTTTQRINEQDFYN